MEHSLPQRACAEVLGTALLVLVGPGSVVATLVLAGDSKPAITGRSTSGGPATFSMVKPGGTWNGSLGGSAEAIGRSCEATAVSRASAVINNPALFKPGTPKAMRVRVLKTWMRSSGL